MHTTEGAWPSYPRFALRPVIGKSNMAATILVVDDEKLLVDAISQHLSGSGYQITGLSDSKQALNSIQENNFDLVLTDLRMPEVSGMEIVRAIHEKGSDTRIIILTGFATLDSAIEAVNLNVFSYLNKPFDLCELGQIVDQALTAQRLERENNALQIRIGNMLEDISTLCEVTRFLYDADDWAITRESILETLAIGLSVTHSCILLKTREGGYSVEETNFPEGSSLDDRIIAHSWELPDDVISTEEPTLLNANGKSVRLLDDLSPEDESLQGIFFVPIHYHENTLGFLVVFLPEGQKMLSGDQRKLLQIVAIQIAPQVFQHIESQQPEQTGTVSRYSEAERILQQYIAEVNIQDGPLGVSILRFLTPRSLTTPNNISAFHQLCSDLLYKHEPRARCSWIEADTALVFIPGANQVQSEITCMAMAEEFRTLELESIGGSGVAELFYVSYAWPHDSMEISDFWAMVWGRLVKQIHEYTYKQGFTRTDDGR